MLNSTYDSCSTKSDFEDMLSREVFNNDYKGSDLIVCLERGDAHCPSSVHKPELWDLFKACYKMLPASAMFSVPGDQTATDLRESFAKLHKDLVSTISALVKPVENGRCDIGGGDPEEPATPTMKHYVNITTGTNEEGEPGFCAKKWTDEVKPKVETALKTIPVVRSRVNSDHTRLYFPNEDQMKEAEKVLTPLAQDCSVSFFSEEAKKLEPKVTVNDLDPGLLKKETILAAILDKNENIKKLYQEDKTLKVVFVSERDRYAVIQMAPEIRRLLSNNGDRINLGLRQHVVKNRYHVIQCYHCQGFGHIAGSPYCPQKDTPVCCFCAGTHQTQDCRAKKSNDTGKMKCVNCAVGGSREDKKYARTHTASSMWCPSYINERARLMERTSCVSKEEKNLYWTRTKDELHRKRLGRLGH